MVGCQDENYHNLAVSHTQKPKVPATSQAQGHNAAAARKIVVSTGNRMLDQFKPLYFGVAFGFMFSFCTGMPDFFEWQETQRHSRVEGAPRLEQPLWDSIMARRVEGQFVRDWHMGFVSWNCNFKTSVNLSRTLWSYESIKEGNLTPCVVALASLCGPK